jgi:hypothetical protein
MNRDVAPPLIHIYAAVYMRWLAKFVVSASAIAVLGAGSVALAAEPNLLPGKPNIWSVGVGTGGYSDIDPRYRSQPWPQVEFTPWGAAESKRLETPPTNRFHWTDPHVWLEILVPDEKGGTMQWSFEMGAPGMLTRTGWKSRIGDQVTVIANPLNTGESRGRLVRVTLPGGREMGPGSPPPKAIP